MPRPNRTRLALECLETRANPNVDNDLSQFSEGGVLFSEITPVSPDLPPPRADFGVAVFNGKMLIFGGRDANGQPLSDLWEYDPVANTWTELPQSGAAPGAVTNGVLAALNSGQLVFFGGTGANPLVYTRSTGVWEAKTPNPAGSRTGHTAFAKLEALFVFGGMKADGTKSNDLFVYVNSVNDWTLLNPSTAKPPARTDAAGAQIDNAATNFSSFFVFGGDGSELRDAWRFDQQGLVWTQLADMPEALIDARALAFKDGSADKILVYGGRQGGGFRDAAFLYDVASNTWTVLPDPAPGERAAVGLVNASGRILLFGGEGPDNPVTPPPAPPPVVPPPGPPVAVLAGSVTAVGGTITDGTGRTITPFGGHPTTVALGDLTGDGVADIVAGAAAGGGPHVKVIDGATGAEVRSFFAFDPNFPGGVFVAVGDVTGDGSDDLIVGAGAGGGSHVKVFDGKSGAEVRSFFAYTEGFTGGVRVASGDLNRDGAADVITAAGPGGGPHVLAFDGRTGAVILSFFAFDPAFPGGVFVAAGDFGTDGTTEIVTGAGPGGTPQVTVFDAGGQRRSFLAFAPAFPGGVRVAVRDADADGDLDIVTAAGPGGGPHVNLFDPDGMLLASAFAGAADDLRGVFV